MVSVCAINAMHATNSLTKSIRIGGEQKKVTQKISSAIIAKKKKKKWEKIEFYFYCPVNKAQAKWWFVQINLAIYSLSRTHRICRCSVFLSFAGYFRNSIWVLLVWGQWHISSYYKIDTFVCVRLSAACDINFVIFIILVWYYFLVDPFRCFPIFQYRKK